MWPGAGVCIYGFVQGADSRNVCLPGAHDAQCGPAASFAALVTLKVGETLSVWFYLADWRAGRKPLRISGGAHHDGNYFADDETVLDFRIEGEGRIAFRWAMGRKPAMVSARDNCRGAERECCRVLGMMPHPERGMRTPRTYRVRVGGADGRRLCRQHSLSARDQR